MAGGLGKAVRGSVRGAGWLAGSIALLAASLVLQLNAPIVRRVVVRRVNELVLSKLFQGNLVIHALGHLDAGGVSDVSADVLDAEGRPVILAEGISARINTVKLLETLALGPRDIVIDLPSVKVRQVDVRLDMDDRGLAVANAFLPRKPSTTPRKPPDGHGVQVYLPHVHLDHVWGHGQMLTIPYFDDDVSGIDAALSITPNRLTLDARRGNVTSRRIALGKDASGAFTGHFDLALDQTHAMGGRFTWDGSVAGIRETAKGGIDKGQFDATVDIHDAPPEAIRSVWAASPITATGAAHLEAHGPLDAIDVAMHAALDATTVDVHGQLGWGNKKRAKIHVDADAIDIRQFAPAVATSALGLQTDLDLTLDDTGRLSGAGRVEVAAGRVAGVLVPHATLVTAGFRQHDGAFGGDATLVVDEPGAPTTLTLHAVPRGHSSSIAFTIATQAVRLDSVRRLSATATGSAEVLGHGAIDLESLAVDLAIDTHGRGLEQGEVHVGTLSVKAQGHGSLTNPQVDVDVHAESLGWGKIKLTDVDVTAHGRALTPHVTVREHSDVVPDLEGSFDVNALDGPSFSAIDLTLRHAGEQARVEARRARFASGSVAVDDATIEGLGSPVTGSFTMAGRNVRVIALARSVDVKRLARLVDADDIVRSGALAIDADVSLHGAAAEGRARIGLDHASIGMVDGISTRLEASLTGRHFAGSLQASAQGIGSLDIDASRIELGPDGVLSKSAWWHAWGRVEVKGHADLSRVAEHLPMNTLPVGAVRGTVDLVGRLGRDSANDFTPLVELSAATTNLLVAGRVVTRAGVTPSPTDPPPWTISGLDTTTTVRVNGDTGFLELESHLRDALGDLAVLKASSGAIPYQALYAAPDDAIAALEAAAFDARVTLPSRSLATWPPWLMQRQVEGNLDATLSVKGPLTSPHVDLTATLDNADPTAARLTTPLDISAHATYDGTRADLNVKGNEKNHEVLKAEAHLSAKAASLLAGSLGDDWKGAAQLHVDDFPLVTVGVLDDRQIRGLLSGDVTLDDLHLDARARASFAVKSFKIGEVAYKGASASFIADGKQLQASLQIDQPDGFALAEARVAATWGPGLVPVADPSRTLDVSLRTSRFRAAALLPFVQGSCDELDGLLDADARVTFDPGVHGATLVGSVRLTDGLVEVGALGGELHDISARLKLAPGGLLTLEDATASGVSGKIMASASARMKGLAIDSGRAIVQIPKSNPLPLSINGSQLGIIDGKLDVSESLSGDRRTIELKVDVPTLHVVLPESGAQDVQVLGPIEGIKIGTRAGPGGELIVTSLDPDEDRNVPPKTRPEDAVKIHIATHLGDDVTIRRGGDLRVGLAGETSVMIEDKTRLSGQLRLKTGNLNVYGKSFEIETGTVTFVGDDPGNPQINVRAGWTAGDGTRVWADFVGPLRTGKVRLTSDPPYPTNEITQLLLFGTIDGTQGATPGGVAGTSSAAGVAGGAATQPLNRALDQFGLSAVSAKIDTSSVNPKPEVEVQIARNLSIQLAVILGLPPPGSNPDTTFLTIDWRFLKKLSLESTVGNAGSTIVDMVWRYRY